VARVERARGRDDDVVEQRDVDQVDAVADRGEPPEHRRRQRALHPALAVEQEHERAEHMTLVTVPHAKTWKSCTAGSPKSVGLRSSQRPVSAGIAKERPVEGLAQQLVIAAP